MSDSNAAQKQPEKPSHLKNVCPACGAKSPTEVDHCDSCGLIYAKWRDPKQRAAEAKLEALAQQSSTGLPASIKILLFLLIAVPAVIVFVPDVQTLVLGGKLRYNVAKDAQYAHTGAAKYALIAALANGEEKYTLDDVSINVLSSMKVTSTDSGGNTTYKKSYNAFDMKSSIWGEQQLDSLIFSAWNHSISLNAYGGTLDTLMGAAQSAANAQKRMAENKKRQMEERARRAERGLPYGRMAEEAPPEEPQWNPFLNITSVHAKMFNFITDFQFPKGRHRANATWEQPVSWFLLTPHFTLQLNGNRTFKLAGFERTKQGYTSVIEWDWTAQPKLADLSPDMQNALGNVTAQGHYKGKAWIGYKDGIVKKLEGEFDVMLLPMDKNPDALAAAFRFAPGSLTSRESNIKIRGTHTLNEN